MIKDFGVSNIFAELLKIFKNGRWKVNQTLQESLKLNKKFMLKMLKKRLSDNNKGTLHKTLSSEWNFTQ